MGAAYNPRRIEPAQLAALGRSLRTFGAVEPVVANRRTGRIVGGHQRVKAAEAEGFETLPVVWVDLDETAERQLNLALNKISGEWDEGLLGALLEELGTAALDLTGFDGSEVDELIARMRNEARTVDPDEVLEPPKVAVTKPGDLYVLGKHRLLCGDSTKAADVARLLEGEKPFLLLTDPPYGVELDMEWRDRAGARRKGSPPFIGSRDQTTVWKAPSPKMIMSGSKEERVDHPTQKPAVLYTRPIENHLPGGGLVYEPFAGSGTALIAAEQLGRRCFALEIDPVYCDVVVARWERFTGEKAVLEVPS